jgi:hypothetical protein
VPPGAVRSASRYRTVKVTRNSATFPAVRRVRPYDVPVGYPPVWADFGAGVSGHRGAGVDDHWVWDTEPIR